MRVLIVGAGVCGFSLTKALENLTDVEATLIEKRSSWKTGGIGYGLSFWSRTQRLLEDIGFDLADLEKHVLEGYQVESKSGESICGFDFASLPTAMGSMHMVKRDDLHLILRQQVATPVTMGTSILEIRQRSDVYDVALSDGTVRQFEMILGADGFHSQVRPYVCPDAKIVTEGWFYILRWLRGELPRSTILQSIGRGVSLKVYPMAQYSFGAFCFHADRGTRLESYWDLLSSEQRCFAEMTIGQDGYVGEVQHVRCGKFQRDNVHIMGDAAHGISPLIGFGAGWAIEDAWTFQQCYRQSNLQTWHAERLKRKRQVFRAIWLMSLMLVPKRNSMLDLIRDNMLARFPRRFWFALLGRLASVPSAYAESEHAL